MEGCLEIKNSTELLRIPYYRLVYVQADGNYSKLVTAGGREILVTLQKGVIWGMITSHMTSDNLFAFTMVGRSLIINTECFFSLDISRELLVLSDLFGNYYELTASRAALLDLKKRM